MSERTGGAAPRSSHAPGEIDRELDTRKILFVAGGLAGVTLLAIVLMLGLFRVLLAREVAQDPPAAPLAAQAAAEPRPEPHLQITPERDLEAMRDADRLALESYDWVDRNAGRVRIPIDRAMALVAKEGLPARTEGAP
jgi:hypothetical protein